MQGDFFGPVENNLFRDQLYIDSWILWSVIFSLRPKGFATLMTLNDKEFKCIVIILKT